MRKLLSVAMCLALGLAVTGCELPTSTDTDMEETPAVEVEVEGEAVEVIPAEAVEAIDEAMETEEPMAE